MSFSLEDMSKLTFNKSVRVVILCKQIKT
jgi:hypothetical protein